MTNTTAKSHIRHHATDWRRRIEALKEDRCDLDILLKGPWRHRIVIRDDGSDFGQADVIATTVKGDAYAALTALVVDHPDVSLPAMALACLHRALEAYGNGAKTVIGHVKVGDPCARLYPSVVDHRLQSPLSQLEAVRDIAAKLRSDDGCIEASALLGQGLFDAVLFDTPELRLPSIGTPPMPIVLLLHDDPAASCLHFALHYTPELFEREVMTGVVDIVVEGLRQIAEHPFGAIADLELLSHDQKRQIQQWNATDGEFPESSRLDELFEAAVQRSPDRCAVACGDEALSYEALNQRCNRLAHRLLEESVQPGEIVGLYLDKSYRIVVSTLGLWKAGAAYIPFDPSYPAERIQFSMRDTGSHRIITHRHYADRLREMLADVCPNLQLIDIDDVLADAGDGATDRQANPQLELGSTQIAYVTYTSGTTGIPKGVAKAHRSVVNSITDLSERYHMLEPGTEHVALFAALVFEPFMRQTLIALINAQTLVVVPDDVRLDPIRFPRFIADHRISYLNGTLSVLQHFDLRGCPSLKRMLLVGEELTPSGLKTLRERFEGRIINEYAFTETAFVTAIKEYPPGDDQRTDRSIGRPLRNVKCYILSQNLKQVPIGAIGELYIGGTGVADGYLNRPDLTAERFLANPFRTEGERAAGRNARMYKTGDLARYLPDGQVEFMGRSDFQLKLNGVRVELGEIEARVLDYPGVRQCVVMARGQSVETGNWHLVGYYVADRDEPVLEADLLAHLESRLIRVMIPARLVRLDAFPVNVNGKVDRRALPEIDVHVHTAYQRPCLGDSGHSDLASALRTIWSEVLGVGAADISDDADFFRLGGQSITCLQLIMRIWQRFRVSISVENVYSLKTFGQLAHSLMLKLAEDANAPAQESEAPPASDCDRMLATGLQQGMLYQAMKSDESNDAYVMQSLHHYHRAIDAQAMKQAWLLARQKYPSLRLRFEWHSEATQCLDRVAQPLAWQYVDLSGLSATEIDARLAALQQQDRLKAYRLEVGQLFRIYLVKRGNESYSVLFSCHHIILDGWSLPLLHDTVHRFYIQLMRGEAIDVQEDTAYVAAQRHLEANRHAHLNYWKSQFERISDAGDFAGLLNARSRYKVDFGEYDTVREHRTRTLSVDTACVGRIKEWCAANRVTLHSVLQFAWHKLLFAIGGSQVTSVGTVVSGRGLPVDGIENSVGLYINTLPSIVDHAEQARGTVAEALTGIQDAINRMNSRSGVELLMIQTQGNKRRLFETLLVLENYPRLLDESEAMLHQEYLRFEKSYDADKVDYPIAVVARENGEALDIQLWYASEILDDSAIDTLLGVLDSLLRQIANGFDEPVERLSLVGNEDLRRFDAWNRTEAEFADERTLHAGFELAAAACPDVVAVVSGENTRTYRELNRHANRMSRFLHAQASLGADRFVALMVDKSESMIAAILAVWKAGAAYVPIDPSYPEDRVRFILEDTGARLLLTDSRHVDRLCRLAEDLPCRVVGVQDIQLEAYPDHNPASPTASTDLAYAIYTSGTTGRPKAVLIEHRGVVNLHASLERQFALRRDNGEECILSFSNYVFDHFVEQMTDALLSGQTLVMLDDAMRTDKARLYDYMNRNRVTYLSGTPSVLSLYEYDTVPSLKRIDAIGEDFTTPVFDKIRSTFDGVIINGYGPTEISITSHKRLYQKHEPRLDKSIGHPVANTACYVLNAWKQQVPVGGIGELYIGGVGVARGYLNRPELTGERFVPNPFRTGEEKRLGTNARLYRTGDLVRWLPNGELEYLGRNDMQVKIRGQRVELGEIEAVLASCPGVARALVLARQYADAAGGCDVQQKYLVAFYLSETELQETDILHWMRARLPQAIVPVRAMRIPEIPVTASGKLDPKRLPATDFAVGRHIDHVAPSTPMERELCRLWAKAIGVSPERIGTRDDFFGSGGDSLRAIRLAQSIAECFGQPFNIANVFAYPDILAQAKFLALGAVAPSVDARSPANMAAALGARPPASLAQERLLFIDDFVGGTAAYNVPFACLLDVGHGEKEAAIGVEAALRALLGRHAALRTLLQVAGDGTRLQTILDHDEALRRFDVPRRGATDRVALDRALVDEFAHVFKLSDSLPMRARIFRVDDMPRRLVLSLVFHHACFDGQSWQIFREELETLLAGVAVDDLPQLKASYADFAVWQRDQLSGQRLGTLHDHWQKALAGWHPLHLPLDHPRPVQFDYLGGEIEFDIDAATTDQLRVLAQSGRISLFSVMLGAYYLTLQAFSGQSDLIVGTPSAHRRHADFDGVVGFFANMLGLRTTIDSKARLLDYLRSIGQVVLQAQLHEDMPFEEVVRSQGVEADASRHPVFQVVFSLLNEESVSAASTVLQPYKPDDDGRTTAKFDLSTTVSEQVQGLSINVTYATSLFDRASIDIFAETYQQILRELCRLAPRADSCALSEIRYTHPRQCALPRVVGSGFSEPLHATFARMAVTHADATAVVHGDARLTYAELDAHSSQLANVLRRHAAIGSSDFIALAMDKSQWTIVAILAVWKAGAAYLPIDTGYPDERIAFMLQDTDAKLVLADGSQCARLLDLLGDAAVPVLDVRTSRLDHEPHASPRTTAGSADIAYAIYTSGTTGQPKAVLVTHGNVQSFRAGLAERYFGAETPGQAVLFLSSYVFDFSIEQLALSILSGHTLIVPEATPVFDDEFYARMNRDGLSYISGTPTQVALFDLSRFDHLGAVLVAGEAFRTHHFDRIRKGFSGPLYSAYGTTETTVYNLVRRFAPGQAFSNDLGETLPNSALLILDSELREVPRGGVGEICIAGGCVSAGYLHREQLTLSRFVPHPYRERSGHRGPPEGLLYKTGDLARRRHRGDLEFIGRNDHQVKINGVRIELGEIEAVAAALPGILQCAVVARPAAGEPGSSRLVCYYVARDDIHEYALAQHLRAKLTPAMVPATLTRIDSALPLTVNGKLDVATLARHDRVIHDVGYVAPGDRLQTRLARLWSEVLHGRLVGANDDFFQIGGDSITALHLAGRIRRQFGQKINVKQIFDFPTIRGFSENVLKSMPEASTEALPPPPIGECPLLPIQGWFFAKPLQDRGHWNQYLTIRTPALQPERVASALDRLVRHHDAFRLRYRGLGPGDRVVQYHADFGADLAMPFRALAMHAPDEHTFGAQLQGLQRSFDLTHGPLCCAALITGFTDGSARVWMCLHHLIVDSVSWEILCRDLEALYHGESLKPPSADIARWATALQAYVPDHDEQRLWEETARDVTAEKAEHAWTRAPGQHRHDRIELGAEATAAIIGRRRRSSAFHPLDLMLAALAQTLHDITGRSRHFVTMENHGREALEPAPDVQDAVGWFTTMYPLAIVGTDEVATSLAATQASRRRIPKNGLGYGALRGAYGTGQAPLPQISFNYLGMFAGAQPSPPEDAPDAPARWRLDAHHCGMSSSDLDLSASDGVIDITVRCIGERLVVDIGSRIDQEASSRIAILFKKRLEGVSTYMEEAGETLPTRSRTSSVAHRTDRFEPYFVLNDAIDSPTLFVLPPGEGGAESYMNNIAKKLPQMRLVLFNNVHLHTPMASFEEIARYYLPYVRRLQPRGPYHFFGWSFGGICSLELALQLHSQGEQISNLLMVDSFFNTEKAIHDLGLPRHGNSLDPINHRYQPDRRALRTLADRADNIVLFKATRPIVEHADREQRQVFDYYAKARFNNLDTFIPPSSFSLDGLGENSHFSWVHDREAVERVSARIVSSMQESMAAWFQHSVALHEAAVTPQKEIRQ